MTYAEQVAAIADRVFVKSCEAMTDIPDGVVHTCVTSPPYLGLRDYHVAGQIGLEATLDEWIARLVGVFREVRRVLRDDGTLWVNVGDAWATRSTYNAPRTMHTEHGWKQEEGHRPKAPTPPGVKPKDLIGQPWALAFALRADGWYLRDAIIFAKPNPMPSSVTDRCTPAYEFIFMLAKSKRYFADMDAVRTPLSDASLARLSQTTFDLQTGGPKDYGNGTNPSQSAPRALENLAKRKPAGWDTRPGRAHGTDALGRYSQFRQQRDNPSLSAPPPPPQVGEGFEFHPLGANLRNVWTIPTQPYPGEHFATFPVELPTRCIKIGTSEAGCCAECGAPLKRVVDVGYYQSPKHGPGSVVGRHYVTEEHTFNHFDGAGMPRVNKSITTRGFERACEHDAPIVPCLVLDPFLGSGTTGEAATVLGRRWVGYELNADYAALVERRPAIAERRAYEAAMPQASA